MQHRLRRLVIQHSKPRTTLINVWLTPNLLPDIPPALSQQWMITAKKVNEKMPGKMPGKMSTLLARPADLQFMRLTEMTFPRMAIMEAQTHSHQPGLQQDNRRSPSINPALTDHALRASSISGSLTPELVAQYEQKKIEFDSIYRTYCSNPTCSSFIHSDSIIYEISTCANYDTRTCIMCKASAHKGDCPLDTGLQLVLQYANEKGLQRCYSCRRIVELDHGCNHMWVHLDTPKFRLQSFITPCRCSMKYRGITSQLRNKRSEICKNHMHSLASLFANHHRICPCGAQFCYICSIQWKTCQYVKWNEDRLLVRARTVVGYRPMLPSVRKKLMRLLKTFEFTLSVTMNAGTM